MNLVPVATSWAETLNACKKKSGEVHAATRQVLPDEAGTEHHLECPRWVSFGQGMQRQLILVIEASYHI
nr:hypothetical protein [Candidatus Freyarchaeota archaeon]